MAGDAFTCQSHRPHDIISTFADWRWRSTSTSMRGWKDAAAMKWKLRWTRWLRMLACHISGRSSQRTCQVCLYVCTLTCFGSRRLVEIMQECKCTFWCVHQILSSPSSFPVGRNIICRLSLLFRMKLPCPPLPAHVCAAVSAYTCTVPVCHRL